MDKFRTSKDSEMIQTHCCSFSDSHISINRIIITAAKPFTPSIYPPKKTLVYTKKAQRPCEHLSCAAFTCMASVN